MSNPRKTNDRPRRPRGPRDGARRDRSGAGAARRSSDTDWNERPDWGGVARRGAARVDPRRGRTSGIQPPRVRPDSGDVADERHESDRPEPQEEWILESVETEAERAVRRGGTRPSEKGRRAAAERRSGPGPRRVESTAGRTDASELFAGAGSAQRAALLDKRLREASRAYGRERYGDALKILRPLARDVPGVAEVRELLGLTYYRMGRWKDASRELVAFAEMTGSTEQHPVLADCARAQGRFREVEDYWDRLRRASPSADLVAEGRMVMAGALADRGRLDEAVALMEAGRRKVKKPKERHLRMAYVLADLQERAGDLPSARSGFSWLVRQDPDFGDVTDRLAALR